MGTNDFYPNFTEKKPEEKSYRSIFKWGAPDKFKHPNKRLYKMLKETFKLTDADFVNMSTKVMKRLF